MMLHMSLCHPCIYTAEECTHAANSSFSCLPSAEGRFLSSCLLAMATATCSLCYTHTRSDTHTLRHTLLISSPYLQAREKARQKKLAMTVPSQTRNLSGGEAGPASHGGAVGQVRPAKFCLTPIELLYHTHSTNQRSISLALCAGIPYLLITFPHRCR